MSRLFRNTKNLAQIYQKNGSLSIEARLGNFARFDESRNTEKCVLCVQATFNLPQELPPKPDIALPQAWQDLLQAFAKKFHKEFLQTGSKPKGLRLVRTLPQVVRGLPQVAQTLRQLVEMSNNVEIAKNNIDFDNFDVVLSKNQLGFVKNHLVLNKNKLSLPFNKKVFASDHLVFLVLNVNFGFGRGN